MIETSGMLLVVDDDELNRSLLATILKSRGYLVETAEDGRRALALLRDRKYDVVLLDLMMPEMDGYEVLERMKSDNELRPIPVIVISAVDDMESVIRCIEMGATDYLPKPFDPVLLRARVNASMASKRLHDLEQAYLRRLQAVSARLQAIFEGAATGIALLTMEGRMLDVNPAFQRMLGYRLDEVSNCLLTDFAHSEDAQLDANLFQELAAGMRGHYQVEKRFYRKDGHLIWGNLTVSLIRQADGSPQFAVGMVEDITERKRAEERLKYLGTHDTLTGLHNRAYFEEELSRLGQARSYPISLLVADVNSLKETNDNLGHAVGDEVLRRTAQVLTSAFRAQDVIARVGGDEFVVIFPETDGDMVNKAVGRARDLLAAHNDTHGGPPLSVSLGAATAEKGTSLVEALKIADERMYRDKQAQKQR